MKKITIDEGNTSVKLAVFEGDHLVLKENYVNLNRIEALNEKCDRLIISSVKSNTIFDSFLNNEFTITLNSSTPIPISINYDKKNIGSDRLALAVGATETFPNADILVIDAGTCITFDFINSKKEYLGGSISPGINMRYNALHKYTSKLPLLKIVKDAKLIGENTENSIHSGIINGVRCEIDGIIDEYTKNFTNLKVIITGGDIKFFDKALKNSIFAKPNLLMEGLNRILDYNESYF